ncbi:hypothetical protein [Aestuariibacter sp. GS-14]
MNFMPVIYTVNFAEWYMFIAYKHIAKFLVGN